MSKSNDGPKRQMTLTLDEDLFPGVLSYMETHGIERVSSAVKSLVTEALAATPRDGASIAAAKRAYNEVMTVLLKETGQFYAAMGKMTDDALAGISGRKFSCPHCGGSL